MTDAALLAEVLGLKELPRAGWLRVGIRAGESVADHSFGVAFAALVLAPPGLDRARVLELALVHDLPEVRVGDITPYDGVSREEKKAREAAAAADLFADHPRLAALWAELEAGTSPEARFVKTLDHVDLRLQARRYGARGFPVEDFLASTEALAAHWVDVPLSSEGR